MFPKTHLERVEGKSEVIYVHVCRDHARHSIDSSLAALDIYCSVQKLFFSLTAVCSARGYERVCDERLRAALLNIDKVGWKTVRQSRVVGMESARAGER